MWKSHGKKHDIANPRDHTGDIYNSLIGAINALTAANVAVDTQTMTDAIAAAIVGMSWQTNIIRFEAMVTNEPSAPSDGDRYISTEAGTIPSTTQAVLVDDVCEWDSGTSLWVITTPEDGWAVIEDEVDPNIAWWYSGTQWRKLGTIVDHANLLNLNWSVAGHAMDTDLSMDTHKITDVVNPTTPQGVATKVFVEDYVDDRTEDISCSAFRNAVQPIPPNEWTPLILNDEEFDTNTMHKNTNEDNGTATGVQGVGILQDTSKSWGVNAYQNMLVVITGGLGVGQIRKIVSNTIDTLTITPNWTITPDATSTYEITIASRLIIPTGKDGKYNTDGMGTFAGNANNLRGIAIQKNGAPGVGTTIIQQIYPTAGGQESGSELSKAIDVVGDDEIEIWVYQSTGANLDIVAGADKTFLQVIAQRGVN